MNKITKNLATIFCVGVLGINAFAQTKNEDFRKTQPAPLANRPVNLPTPFEKTLANGLKIVVIEDKRLPLVSFSLAFRSGEVYDGTGTHGLTSMMTGLLKEGTATRSSKQIADEIEKLGGSVYASASDDNTFVSASSLSQYSTDILKLMADVTLNPSFPQKEIDLAKQNTIQGLDSQRADPSFLANEQFSKEIWGSHPYGIVSPTKETISAITREKLVDFHKKMFIPNNALLVVSGDVDKLKITAEIEKLFGGWQKGTAVAPNFALPTEKTGRAITVVHRDGSSQSNIVLGNLAIKRTDPDYFPMLVLNQVYGGGSSARLFMNIREEKGYTYGAYSNFDTRRLAGLFSSSAEVRNEVTGASLKEFFYEMERIRTTPVPEKELADAKNYLTGVFPLQIETQEALLNRILSNKLNDLPENYLQTYRDKINAVTPADVQRVANKYITPDKVSVVIVGDGAEIIKQVKPYSTNIKLFDTNGKALEMAKFENAANAPKANVAGKWQLSMSAMGQTLPVSLELKEDGDKITGTMESPIGKGTLENAKISGNKFTASSKITFQGQNLELKFVGTVEGDDMKGTVDTGFPGAPPFPFSGKRSK